MDDSVESNISEYDWLVFNKAMWHDREVDAA